jgi:hypothetical protein
MHRADMTAFPLFLALSTELQLIAIILMRIDCVSLACLPNWCFSPHCHMHAHTHTQVKWRILAICEIMPSLPLRTMACRARACMQVFLATILPWRLRPGPKIVHMLIFFPLTLHRCSPFHVFTSAFPELVKPEHGGQSVFGISQVSSTFF